MDPTESQSPPPPQPSSATPPPPSVTASESASPPTPVTLSVPVAAEKISESEPAPPASVHSPLVRNAIHIGAFLLFFVPFGMLVDPRNKIPHGKTVVVVFMLLITVFNMLVLPWLESGKRIKRPGESFVSGQWLYPFSLAICFWFLPPFAAMSAWAAMAGGDAAASFAGRLCSYPRLPWNQKKSWAGVIGFIAVALPCCWIAMYLCPSVQFLKIDESPELPFLWTLSVLAAVSGALLESIESTIDDNLRVPLGVGVFTYMVGMFLSWSTRGLDNHQHIQPEQLLSALAYNAALGGLILTLGFADVLGTVLGVLFGAIIYFIAGWQGYVLFLMFVAVGSLLSKIGLKHKQEIGAAEEREGKRGIGNVAANLLVPTLCCLLYPTWNHAPAMMLAFAGSLAAAFADTASSEIGSLGRGLPVLITTRKEVPHGTNGGITLLGFGAAILAATLLAIAAQMSGFFDQVLIHPPILLSTWQRTALIGTLIFAGLAGTTVDSLLGATVENRLPFIGKGIVNFACTLTGAVVAGALALLWL